MATVTFLGMEVGIPADPVGFIQDKAIVLLNHLGYEWPVTDDAALDAWGDQWAAIEGRINAFVDDLHHGVLHVASNNEGAFVEAFEAYMRGDDSNLNSLKSIADAAPMAAMSYHGAATIVRALRAYVIGKLVLDAVSLALAIVTGGTGAGASFLIRTGLSGAINIAIDQAMNQLLGGE